ncbi:MAG: hypothetical protein A3F54_04950 [Candidatus Kerfeldbacteria bacterium RIFCSPHIGHO2_12_FULL_48_17]|uniref:ComEC/Rec2-related protein domain-containing protein n=1 Tax=Candidatus Kerfeldbacteria bacterium RIFCSPHIGHO2_12_FULL_48_17 TaxID=1798542 RepID=A0A1G2B3C5_9BACT|nr:MAG: hypothetical protein A3F54_04950 [Candidatus Kerfeldbacteria bacterium RIFCSPHIGHO2_12_FULL_48_17]
MHLSQKFFIVACGFFAGIGVYFLCDLPAIVFVFAVFSCFIFVFFARSRVFFVAVLCCIMGFAGGYWRAYAADPRLPPVLEHTLTFTGIVSREVDQRLDATKLTVASAAVSGSVLVTAPLYPEYSYGDVLEIRCTLERPGIIDGFRYDRFLELTGVYWTCSRPAIRLVSHGQGNQVMGFLLVGKGDLLGRINRILHEPYASFLAGLLLGVRRGFTPELLAVFQRAGTTHILAISGYNITLIVGLMQSFFLRLGLRRQQAFWLLVFGVAVFVIFVGASASVVRAGIMGVLVLLARQWGQRAQVRQILTATALVMVAHRPQVLVYDAGFQLSFLSTVGLVYLSAPLERVVRWLPERFGLRENAGATLAATLATLPLSLFQFGGISVVAMFTNVLVLPLMPLAMGLGFLAVMASFVSWPVAQVFGYPVWLVLLYALRVMEWFAGLSWSYWPVAASQWQFMAAAYAVLGWLMWVRFARVPKVFFRHV